MEKALETVIKEFDGVVDKAGTAYKYHCFEVAKRAYAIALGHDVDADKVYIAALLHDLVEDIEHWTIEDVAREFGEDVATIVDNVTKRAGESAEDYMKRVKLLPESVIVKAGDSGHNSVVDRFEAPTEVEIASCAKYAKLSAELLGTL